MRTTAICLAILAACGRPEDLVPAPSHSTTGTPGPDDPGHELEPADIHGVVIDRFGMPVSGATVVFVNQKVVTTDEAGEFVATDIERPYTASVVSDQLGNWSWTFVDLTRRDPTLLYPDPYLPDGSERVAHSATVRVTIPHAPAHSMTSVFLGGKTDDGMPVRMSTWEKGTNSDYVLTYELTARWFGAQTSLDLSVHALQWTPPAGASLYGDATDFVGYGTDEVTVEDGDILEVSLPLGDVSEILWPNSMVPPEGYNGEVRYYAVEIGEARSTSFSMHTYPLRYEGAITVPDIAGARPFVYAEADDVVDVPVGGIKHSVAAESYPDAYSPGELRLGMGPTPVSPAEFTEQAPASQLFAWLPTDLPSVYRLRVACSPDSGPDYFARVFTTNMQTTLPDLTSAGVAVPSMTYCDWDVPAISQVKNMDEVATRGFLINFETIGNWHGGMTGSGSLMHFKTE
jgi:hypothetical protein